jgi:hypothetical protein
MIKYEVSIDSPNNPLLLKDECTSQTYLGYLIPINCLNKEVGLCVIIIRYFELELLSIDDDEINVLRMVSLSFM